MLREVKPAENSKVAESVQQLLPENHPFKKNFAIAYDIVRTKNYSIIDEYIQNKVNSPLDFVFLAAESGKLGVCSKLIFNYSAFLHEVTPKTNFLLIICQCPDLYRRKDMLAWLLDCYDKLPLWKPFTKNHVKAALGRKEALKSLDIDNLGYTCEDYYISSGFELANSNVEIISFSNEKIWRYLHTSLNLKGLVNFLVKYKQSSFDINYKPNDDEASLGWYFAYYTAIGFDEYEAVLYCVASATYESSATIQLDDIGPKQLPTSRHHTLSQYFEIAKQNMQELVQYNKTILQKYTRLDVLRVLLLTKKFDSFFLYLQISPKFYFDFTAPLLEENPNLSIADFIISNHFNFDFICKLLRVFPQHSIDVCNAFGFKTDKKNRHILTLALLTNRQYSELHKLLDADTENRLTFDVNYKISMPDFHSLQRFGILILDKFISNDLLEKIIPRIESRSIPRLTLEHDFEKRLQAKDSILAALLEKQYEKLLLLEVEKFFPNEFHFKSNFPYYYDIVKSGKLLLITNDIKEKKHTALDFLYFAAELGQIMVCHYLTDKFSDTLDHDWHKDRNLLVAICNCDDKNLREFTLQWLYQTYDELPISKPFTKNHIRAALGITEALRCLEVDNLGLTCEDYFLGSGYVIQPIDSPPFELTNEKIWHYLQGPLNLSSFATYLSNFSNPTIDMNYQPPGQKSTLAWYLLYHLLLGFDHDHAILGILKRQNSIKLDAIGDKEFKLSRPNTIADAFNVVKDAQQERILKNYSILTYFDLSVIQALLLTLNYSAIYWVLKNHPNFSFDLNAPMNNDYTIGEFLRSNDCPTHFYAQIVSLYPQQIPLICKYSGFHTKAHIRAELTYIMIKHKLYSELEQILDRDTNYVLTIDLNKKIHRNEPISVVSFGRLLLDEEVPSSLLEKMIARAENPYNQFTTNPKDDFDTRIWKHSNKNLYAALQQRYSKFAHSPKPLIHSETETKVKNKPKKETQIFSTPVNVQTKQTLSPEQDLPNKLKTCFDGKSVGFQIQMEKNVVSITLKGDVTSIRKISELTKSYVKSFFPQTKGIDRSQIDKGLLILKGQLNSINSLFSNGTFLAKLNSSMQVKQSSCVNPVTTTHDQPLKQKIFIDFTKDQTAIFSKNLHHAFCDAAQAKVTWDKENRQFVVTVNGKESPWTITAIRHSTKYLVSCTEAEIQRYIISRVIHFFSEIKHAVCSYDNSNVLRISFYEDDFPDLSELRKNIYDQFTSWPYQIVKEEKVSQQVTLFSSKSAAVTFPASTAPVLTSSGQDILFKQLCAQLMGKTLEQLKHLWLERIIKERKYEFSCKCNKEDVFNFRAIEGALNHHFQKRIISLYENNGNVKIILNATSSELNSILQDINPVKMQFKYALANEKTNDKGNIQPPTESFFKDFKDAIVIRQPDTNQSESPLPHGLPQPNLEVLICNDKKTLELAVKNIAAKSDSMLAKNMHIHFQQLDEISNAYSAIKNPNYFYAYLLHATRLFVILAHLSFDKENPENIFYLWRNALRHAHYKQNFENLQTKIIYITSLMKEQINLAFPNVKVIKNETLTLEKIKLLREMLHDYEIPQSKPKHLLREFQEQLTQLKMHHNDNEWAMECEVMLTSLVELYTPGSSRWTYKHLGHNNVYDVTQNTVVLRGNFHRPFHVFMDDVYKKITQSTPKNLAVSSCRPKE